MEKDILLKIFDSLAQAYGPRHWWPADSPFEVIVGAILTQNVSWRNVEKGIFNLKEMGAMDPEAMTKLPREELAQAIRPTGYYNMKAIKIKAFMDFLNTAYGGSLTSMFRTPCHALRRQLLAVKGIGPETADSILLYAGGYPVFVVDAYTKRIFSRLGCIHSDDTYDAVQKFFLKHLPVDSSLYNEFHALIVALGSSCCSNRNPKCKLCPLLIHCPVGNTTAIKQKEE